MKPERIVVVGHGDLPDALLASARMIAGALPAVTAVGLLAGETPTSFGERLALALETPGATLVLSDLRGGTPDNVACVLARKRPLTWVLANTSLPLLIECALGDVELTPAGLEEVADLVHVPVSHRADVPAPTSV